MQEVRAKPKVADGTLREILADQPFQNDRSDLSTILAAAPKVRKWPKAKMTPSLPISILAPLVM